MLREFVPAFLDITIPCMVGLIVTLFQFINSFLLANKEAVMIEQQTNKIFRADLGSQQNRVEGTEISHVFPTLPPNSTPMLSCKASSIFNIPH